LKILEAMAAQVPVISTALGAEGLMVEPGRDILIAGPDDPEAWARHLAGLIELPERTIQITAAALRLVSTRYDWEIVGQKLSDTYEEWLRSAG
jgi:glycosyltransferase involved in cell wall biosynthesis